MHQISCVQNRPTETITLNTNYDDKITETRKEDRRGTRREFVRSEMCLSVLSSAGSVKPRPEKQNLWRVYEDDDDDLTEPSDIYWPQTCLVNTPSNAWKSTDIRLDIYIFITIPRLTERLGLYGRAVFSAIILLIKTPRLFKGCYSSSYLLWF